VIFIIASNTGGVGETISEYCDKIIIEPGNADDLERAIMTKIKN